MKTFMKLVAFGIVLAAGLFLWFFVYDSGEMLSINLVHSAAQKVKVGATSAQVEAALSDAWHRDECTSGGTKQELFFFGSKEVSETAAVLVTYDGAGKVSGVKEVDHSSLPAYASCSSLDLSKAK